VGSGRRSRSPPCGTPTTRHRLLALQPDGMSRAAGLYRLSTGARLSDPHRDQAIGGAWRLWCVQVIGTLRGWVSPSPRSVVSPRSIRRNLKRRSVLTSTDPDRPPPSTRIKPSSPSEGRVLLRPVRDFSPPQPADTLDS
jgi:hypothetical protein